MDKQDQINKVVILDNNDILPNRFQPRKYFDEEEILQLSESIKEHGVINPIIVRKLGDKYELVAGERRYKANIIAGNDSIPSIIMNINDKESSEIAVVENVQRKDLNAIEEAISYKRILDIGYMTQEQLAHKMGKSQSAIANKIRLLKLSDEVQDALMKKEISERHARSLLRIESPIKQNEMLERIISERLTVRKTDEEIDKMNNNIIEPATTPVENNVEVIPTTSSNIEQNNQITNPIEEQPAVAPEAPIPGINPIEEQPAVVPEAPIPGINPIEEQPAVAPEAPIPGINPIEEQPAVAPEVPIPGINPIEEQPAVAPEAPIPGINPIEEQPAVAPEAPIPGINPIEEQPAVVPEAPIPGINPIEEQPAVAPEAPIPGINPIEEQPAVAPEVPIPGINPIEEQPAVAPEAPIPGINPIEEQPAVAPEAPIPGINPIEEQPAVAPEAPIPGINPIEEQPAVAPEVTIPGINSIEEQPIENKPADVISQPQGVATDIFNQELLNVQSEKKEEQELPSVANESAFEPATEPIITTDYDYQYDPVMPNAAPQVSKVDFKEIINLIRSCSDQIEKNGYKIEVEEYDLANLYQVVFKIDKQ